MLPCDACQQVDGVLSELEAARFIETAERLGLEHQGSRGAAHGEVHDDIKLSLDPRPIGYHMLVVNCNKMLSALQSRLTLYRPIGIMSALHSKTRRLPSTCGRCPVLPMSSGKWI